MQNFKDTDSTEAKVRDSGLPILEALGGQRDLFFSGAWTCFVLGDVLFELNASPLADAISQDAFRKAFYQIHQLFTRPGTFEYYISVLQAVFGSGVSIDFQIPVPGHLKINIDSNSTVDEDFLSRRIVDNAYVFDEIVDEDGNNLAFQEPVGIKTQSETDALIAELCPAGLFVEAILTIA